MIWAHDQAWLDDAERFYRALDARCALDWPAWSAALERPRPPALAKGLDAGLWQRVRDSHRAYQCGMAALALPALIAERSGFDALDVAENLSPAIPGRLADPALQQRMLKALAPPPPAGADAIVAQSGGMFYARAEPTAAPFVSAGSRFEPGDPLYIVEVMKMFTTVKATFSGRIERVLIDGEDGTVVRKGQPLFKVSPDEAPDPADADALAARRRRDADALFARLAGAPADGR